MTDLKDLVEERTKEHFDSARGKGYYYMDCGGRYGPWINELDRLGSYFAENEVGKIRKLITKPSKGVHRIMQQGCGHARSLEFVTGTLARENPNTLIEGYAVSGSIDDIWMIRDDSAKLKDLGINAPKVYSYLSSSKNLKVLGIEQDISTLMKDFPYPLDLVFSDNTYMHLMFQWLAFRRTAEKLTQGGVFLVRSIHHPFEAESMKRMSQKGLAEHLRRLNPSYEIFGSNSRDHFNPIALVRGDDSAPFKTGFNIGIVEFEGGVQRLVEYSGKRGKESLSVDEL